MASDSTSMAQNPSNGAEILAIEEQNRVLLDEPPQCPHAQRSAGTIVRIVDRFDGPRSRKSQAKRKTDMSGQHGTQSLGDLGLLINEPLLRRARFAGGMEPKT